MSKALTPKELENMARIGQLGMLTGDRVLAPLGTVGIKRAQAIHELQLDDAQKQAIRDQEAAKLAEYARWDDEDRAFKRDELKAKLGFDYAKLREDAALRRELKQMGLDAKNADVEALTAAQENAANEWGQMTQDVEDLRDRVKANPGAASPTKQFGVLAAEALAPERFEPWAKSRTEGTLFSQGEQQIRSDLRAQLSARVKAISGAAASDKERADISSFMPGENDSYEQMTSKLDALANYVGSRAKRGRAPAGSLQKDAASGPRNRRTGADGKTYIQVGDDEWEEE